MLFNKIQQFLEYKKYCSICGSVLTPFLKDRNRYLSSINSKLIEGKFKFKLKYVSPTLYLNNKCTIDITSNQLSIKDSEDIFYLMEISRVLESMRIVIELHCTNNKCKHNYYIASTFLKYIIDSEIGISIANFLLDIECYNLSNFFIQNDLIKNISWVYSTNNSLTEPISIPILKINPSNKNKIFNKIKTIINFS